MTTTEEKELKNIINKAWQKAVQVIVQSRLGERCNENLTAVSPTKGTFFLKIEDNPEINYEFKKSFSNQTLSMENPFSIEILLRTKDKEMILEVWTLFVDDYIDPVVSMSSLTSTNTYTRMSLLIKSIMASARLTPAWNLSFRQGDNYVICYRMYNGQPQIECLGEDLSTHLVGEVNIHFIHLKMQVAYRTNLIFESQQRASPYDQMMLKSDHFKLESSPKHFRRNGERVSESDSNSEIPLALDESPSSLGQRPFTNSPLGFRMESPRSRTNSESSHRGSDTNISEQIYIPFANQPDKAIGNFVPELPTANLLIEATDIEKVEECKQEIRALKERRISESKMQKVKSDKVNSSVHSGGRSLPKEEDYVVLDMKSAFAFGTGLESELTDLFQGVDGAPCLKSFAEGDATVDISKELEKFDLLANDFDDLVQSVNSDNLSTESLDFT